jgi:hypothetical protein
MMVATVQLRDAQICLLRQKGQLESWIQSACNAQTSRINKPLMKKTKDRFASWRYIRKPNFSDGDNSHYGVTGADALIQPFRRLPRVPVGWSVSSTLLPELELDIAQSEPATTTPVLPSHLTGIGQTADTSENFV